MAATPRGLLLCVCAVLMAAAITNVTSGEAASVVVGLAKCADCTRKNMKAEAAFKDLQVAIKCKNGNGEYESKAVGKLESSGAFSVPFAAELHSADCLAQLHSAAGTPCPGQEPSRIVPMDDGTFVAVPGKTNSPSAECASATICGPIKKHFLDHFHKKPVPQKPKPKLKPQPKYHTPTPTYHPPTPTYGSSTPIYHPPARHLFDKKKLFDHFHKDHEHHHFFDHFHKKPVLPKLKPEPKQQPEYHPQTPTYRPPTPMYGSPSPIYHPPAKHLFDKKKLFDHFHKDHEHHHFFDHFQKKPMPPKPKLEPKPQPEYHPPTPTYGSPTPIYHPPTPTYGSPTPIYHPPAKH